MNMIELKEVSKTYRHGARRSELIGLFLGETFTVAVFGAYADNDQVEIEPIFSW